jgi:hypothetical protein
MMTRKALLFGDSKVARDVIAIKGSRNPDCVKVKGMGRKVHPFDEEVWVKERGELVASFEVYPESLIQDQQKK